MISYTKRFVNIVSIIITIIIYIVVVRSGKVLKQIDFNPPFISNLLKIGISQTNIKSNNILKNTNENVEENAKEETEKTNNEQNNQTIEQAKEKVFNWKVVIPKISLEAEISESTNKETMNKYVGHFEETSRTNGNIGLAAHNRGYEVNYFSNLKTLKEGDEILYKYFDFEKTYIVSKHKIIKDTDWSYLEQTDKNTITLITCVENEPSYRRCIQAIEKN